MNQKSASRSPASRQDRLAGWLGGHSGNQDRPWLILALAIGLVAGVSLLVQGLSPDAVQDDARQFVFWMARWDDPAFFAGDLMADYWESVSPWFYRLLFYILHLVGISPVLAAKILAAALLPLTALFAFRFVRAFSGNPVAAGLTAGAIVLLFSHGDIVVSGTPRALWPPLLLMVLDGLARRSAVQTALGQLLLCGSYPQVALLGATVIGLTFLKVAPFGLDLSLKRFAIVGSSAAATIAGLLPFILQVERFGPTATIEAVRAMPIFMAGGRNAVLQADGTLNFACGARLGYLSFVKCDGFGAPQFWLVVALVWIGPILWFLRSRRGRPGTPLLLYLACAMLPWFILAALVLFRLHLPSRFAGEIPALLAVLALVPLAADFLDPRRNPDKPDKIRAFLLASGALLVLFAIGSALVNPHYRKPEHPGLMEALGQFPKGTLVAGFVDDLAFVPVLARHPTLFTQEHAVAYQLGYSRAIESRIQDLAEAERTSDPAILAGILERYGIGAHVITEDRLADPSLPRQFLKVTAEPTTPVTGETALSRLAPQCESNRIGKLLVLDAACLVAKARSTDP